MDLLVGRDLTVKRNVVVKEYVTQVGGITIIPLTSGATALRIRDVADSVDRIVLTEDGRLSLNPLVSGSVLFAGSGGLVSQDNANLFWDNVNKRLGIGTTAPAEKLHVVGNVRADAIVNTIMNGLRSYAGTPKTVTETTATVKDEVGPLANRVSLLPMVVKYSANNPTGSGATLYVTLRAVYTDGTTTDIDSRSLAAGTSVDVAITGEALYDLLSDGKILQKIQLLAYCSTTPATGYEPSITLTKVAGISM
jgi:hypothetical protein